MKDKIDLAEWIEGNSGAALTVDDNAIWHLIEVDNEVESKVFEDTLTVRYYSRPNGHMIEIEMKNIDQSEIDFFVDNNIQVSIEELATGNIVVYGCPRDDESEESEVLILANGRSCEETMKDLREECEKAFL